MNEQEQISQLSALFDGELPREQAEMVIRRALKDPALRASWGRYALIGACVRGESIVAALPQSDLAQRLRARLAAEPDHDSGAAGGMAVAAPAPSPRGSLLRRGALGGAIAASVALASVLLVRNLPPAATEPVQMVQQPVASPAVQAVAPATVQAPATLVARESAPPSYTTPVDDSPARRGAPLVNYVAAHGDVAASAVRFAPLFSVMSANYDPAQDAVEMTAAEVGARR
jgi:negative regulator of sigma E activity